MVRDKYEGWEAAGGKQAEEQACDRARELLDRHQPEPLPDEARRELTAIYAAVRRAAGMEE